MLAVGGGNFLIPDGLKGAARVIRPPDAAVANAVGAAIAQVGAQVEQIVSYDSMPRAHAIDRMRAEAHSRIVAAGGEADEHPDRRNRRGVPELPSGPLGAAQDPGGGRPGERRRQGRRRRPPPIGGASCVLTAPLSTISPAAPPSLDRAAAAIPIMAGC